MVARFLAVLLVATACSGSSFSSGPSNPLVGSWTTAVTSGSSTRTETVTVNADGTLSVALTTGGGSCSGTLTYDGYAWTSTATSVTITGSGSCAGTITCGSLTYDCSTATKGVTAGTCTYALSNGNDTLALTGCSGISDATFTRAS